MPYSVLTQQIGAVLSTHAADRCRTVVLTQQIGAVLSYSRSRSVPYSVLTQQIGAVLSTHAADRCRTAVLTQQIGAVLADHQVIEERRQHGEQHQLHVVEAGGRLEVRAADVAVLLLCDGTRHEDGVRGQRRSAVAAEQKRPTDSNVGTQ